MGNVGQEVSATNVTFELSFKKLIRFCLTSGDEEQDCEIEGRA